MSEVESVPPAGAEWPSDRPPSKPSRLPRFLWAGIALFCLVTFGSALGLYLWSREAFSSKDLLKAKSVKITYHFNRKQMKAVVVNDPAELKDLLNALVITDAHMGPCGSSTVGSVEFTLPDGSTAHTMFGTQGGQLNRTNWGYLIVEPGFYRKVNEIASRAEGKPIDIMRVDN